MTEAEKLMVQAEVLDSVAKWAMQPDQPTSIPGYVSVVELRMRAAALRAQVILWPSDENQHRA